MRFKNYDGALFYVLLVFVLVGGALSVVSLSHVASVRALSRSALDPKSLDGQIQRLDQAIAADPQKVNTYISLSQAYLQKVRETADASYYEKINDLMLKAEKLEPKNTNIPAMQYYWCLRLNTTIQAITSAIMTSS